MLDPFIFLAVPLALVVPLSWLIKRVQPPVKLSLVPNPEQYKVVTTSWYWRKIPDCSECGESKVCRATAVRRPMIASHCTGAMTLNYSPIARLDEIFICRGCQAVFVEVTGGNAKSTFG